MGHFCSQLLVCLNQRSIDSNKVNTRPSFLLTDFNMNVTYKTMESNPTDLKIFLKRNSELKAHVPNLGTLISVVALHVEKTIGVIITRKRDPEELRIEHILVIEHFRRKCIATELLNIIENLARHRGFKKMSLLVHIDNSSAQLLYTKEGFVKKERSEIWEFWLKHLN